MFQLLKRLIWSTSTWPLNLGYIVLAQGCDRSSTPSVKEHLQSSWSCSLVPSFAFVLLLSPKTILENSAIQEPAHLKGIKILEYYCHDFVDAAIKEDKSWNNLTVLVWILILYIFFLTFSQRYTKKREYIYIYIYFELHVL